MRYRRLVRSDVSSQKTRKRHSESYLSRRKSKVYTKWLVYLNWREIMRQPSGNVNCYPNTGCLWPTGVSFTYYRRFWEKNSIKSDSKYKMQSMLELLVFNIHWLPLQGAITCRFDPRRSTKGDTACCPISLHGLLSRELLVSSRKIRFFYAILMLKATVAKRYQNRFHSFER